MNSIGIVWNPTKAEKKTLEDELAAAVGSGSMPEAHWWETTVDDPGQDAARRAIAAGAELLIVAGGDGTVRAVAEHLADSGADVPLGIVPLGTGNLLARNLGVPINNTRAALARAIEGNAQSIDVGWVDVELETGSERHAFVVLIGFGIDAHMIAETDEDLKDTAGWLAYVESLGRALKASDVVPFHVAVNDQPGRDEAGHTLLIANCGTLQAGITLLPDADPSDGELDYLILSAEGLGEWLGTLKTMVWDNGLKKILTTSDETISTDSVSHGRAKTLHVTLPEPRPFEIDGEQIGDTRSFTVTIQAGAISVR